jgi:hypothetical protein
MVYEIENDKLTLRAFGQTQFITCIFFFGINALFIFFLMTLSKDTCNKLGLSKSPES